MLEATTGFEPVDGGFADPCLATWLRRPNLASHHLSAQSWCQGGDLNPYARRHGPLKTACLPVPPPRPERNRKATPSPPVRSTLPRTRMLNGRSGGTRTPDRRFSESPPA